MTHRRRHLFTRTGNSWSRRRLLATSAAIAGGIGAASLIGSSGARAATPKTVRFSEAVHNLGYINLYVGMHAGIFKKNGLDMQVSAAGGDTQTFAAVLGGSADFAIGDATMAQISRENGGPGVVVGTVVQRAHYFGVSKTLQPITDPMGFKGLKIVTSPEPNTNYSVAKRLLEKAGLKVGVDATIVPVNPGTEIAAILAGQADIAIAYQPSVAAAEAQGAKVVFDFLELHRPVLQHRHHGASHHDCERPGDGAGAGDLVRGGIAQDLCRSGFLQGGRAQGVPGSARRRR
jgi:NitT/TauT family transport system substrate-binding protein